jgi:ABC-type uncharacterized transport system fused permease/ATPase subunit
MVKTYVPMWFFTFLLRNLSKKKACLLQAYGMQLSHTLFYTLYFVLGTLYKF